MSNFRKFISMSAVAVLAGTNLLAPLSYADAATAWASLDANSFRQNPLEFLMPDSNVYLYAVTAPNTYYVAFNGHGQTSGTMGTQEFTYDEEKALSGNAYAKTGYSFSGWTTEENGGGSGYTNNQVVKNLAETGTVDLYAQWKEHSYTIHYDLNDSTGSSSGVHTKTPASGTYTEPLTIANATRTGYSFSGWNITGMDTNPHTVGGQDSSAATANNVMGTSFSRLTAENDGIVYFLAQWTAKKTPYKVEHYQQNINDDEYTIKDTDNLSGDTDTLADHASKGYSGFGNPNITMDPESGTINADESTVITYKYPRNTYNLTLVPGRGVATVAADGTRNDITASSTTVTSGFKYEEQVTLNFTLKQGYTGGAWTGTNNNDSSFTMPDEAITKTASADVITYNIEYKCRNADEATCPADRTYNVESADITIPDNLTRDHSVFQGWTGGQAPSYLDYTEATQGIKIASGSINNREYSAVWSCVDGYHINNTGANNETCEPDTDTEYTVEHYQQQLDGSYTIVSADTETLSGTTDSPATWTGNKYTGFSGGYLSGAEQTIHGDPANKTVVQVRYDRNSYDYSVTHTTGVDVGVTAVHMDDTKIPYEDVVTLSHTELSGYEFESWTVTGPNGNITVTDNKFPMPAGDVTITANLKKTNYTIEYVLHEGTNNVENPASYNVESEDITLKNPTREHSTFLGWKGTSGTEAPAEATISYVLAKGSVGNKTYEAIWGCNTGYHADGDSCVANTYTVTIDYKDGGNGGESNTGTVTFTYDTGTTIPNPQQSGYKFVGWTITGLSGDAATVDGDDLEVPTSTGVTGTVFKNLTPENGSTTVKFEAVWEAEDVTYTVYHYTRVLSGDTYTIEGTAVTHTGKSNDPVNFNTVTGTYEGFTYTGGHAYTTEPENPGTASGPRDSSVKIDKHGDTKIYLYYDRNKWIVTTAHDTGVNNVTGGGTYEYGATVNVEAHVKSGYHFVQWTGTPTPAPTSVSGS